MGKRKHEKDWKPAQWRRHLMVRAHKGQAAVVDSARKYHLHVCPPCLGDDKVEYVRCTNQRHVALSEYERAEGLRATIEEYSLQAYKFCARHAREREALVKASPPVEKDKDVLILLALCAKWNISPVDALVVALTEDRIRWREVVSDVNQKAAVREYSRRIAAGERGVGPKVAKKWGLNPNSLKGWAKREKKRKKEEGPFIQSVTPV